MEHTLYTVNWKCQQSTGGLQPTASLGRRSRSHVAADGGSRILICRGRPARVHSQSTLTVADPLVGLHSYLFTLNSNSRWKILLPQRRVRAAEETEKSVRVVSCSVWGESGEIEHNQHHGRPCDGFDNDGHKPWWPKKLGEIYPTMLNELSRAFGVSF